MATVKTAVDDITRCIRDMEAVFANASFEDIEIPRKMLEDVAIRHRDRGIVVNVTVRDEWRRRDEDDYYEYAISVPSANAIAHVDMSPPTVYDPYESHDDDDENEKKVVRLEWRNQNVHFDLLFDGLISLTFSTGTIFVWIKRDIPPSARTELVEYLVAIGRQFDRFPTFVCSMRHSDGRSIVRRVNRALSALTE